MKNRPTIQELFNGLRKGELGSLSKAITLVESSLGSNFEAAEELVRHAVPYSGRSVRIGITGIPGAGKSTLIEAIGKYFLDKGHKLAVLAVDPSSQISKGSILGDKTRMETLAAHPDVFIRPSPSGTTLGGVARTTRESIVLCEAAGYDVILVETVGVGQSEVSVHGMVDAFVLVAIPGAGDELQGIKRGIMEMADIVLINKSGGENREKARHAARQLENALHLFPAQRYGHEVKVLLCDALSGEGTEQVFSALDNLINFFQTTGAFEQRRNEQSLNWMNETIREGLLQIFYDDKALGSKYEQLKQQVIAGKISAYEAASRLIHDFKNNLS